MKRTKPKTKAPQIRLVGFDVSIGAAVAVAGLASASAFAAPGDLDPSFGDVGRQSVLRTSGASVPLRSIEAGDDDSVMFGGSEIYCPFGCYENYYIGKLTAAGLPVPDFNPRPFEFLQVLDTASQPDGKRLVVGYETLGSGTQRLRLIRLLPDGAVDASFGTAGSVSLGDDATSYSGHAVTVTGDGRITVAGYRAGALLVARFLADGSPDATFGTNGAFVAPETIADPDLPLHFAALPAGGYRILANTGFAESACAVIGVTAGGALDPAHGIGGSAEVRTAGGAKVRCNSMTVLADGRAVVVGELEDGQAVATRMLATGAVDPSFDARSALDGYRTATAITQGATGKLFVAASGTDPGVHVVRLTSSGSLDTAYGRAGRTTIDAASRRAMSPIGVELKALSGDRLLVAGNTGEGNPSFIARLFGDAGGNSPGVLSVASARPLGTEQQGRAVVKVRRSGGSSGTVAVTYATAASQGLPSATLDADLTPVSGRLEWADGDVSEREIVVPIASDTELEIPEFFAVSLSSPEGGAGLGTAGADVEIAATGYPYGQFAVQVQVPRVLEGQAALLRVSRKFYSQGTVSVTLRVAAGTTATAGQDFASPGQASSWQDVVLTWADGDMADKTVSVSVLRDDRKDPDETLKLELAAPTGGAAISTESSATITLLQPVSATGGGGGGGGALGGFGALLLGGLGLLRRSVRRRMAARGHA